MALTHRNSGWVWPGLFIIIGWPFGIAEWPPANASVTADGCRLHLVFSLILIHPLRHGGLALAYSIASNFSMVALFWLLSRRLKGLADRELARWSALLIGVTLIMSAAVAALDAVLANHLSDGRAWLLIRLFLDGALGAVVYITGASWLRLPEPFYLFKLLREGLARAGLAKY